jgi:NodT family efflux transporter outer membrane factor (OMF) lipoprotein
MFPQSQQILADYTRTQRSTETAFFAPVDPSSPIPALGISDFSNWRIGASLSWELDFWGRYRRSIEGADARLDASIEDYDDVLVLLVSEVAFSYVELRTVQERLKVARENAALQRESARIAQARLDLAAADSEVDAPQAKSNLARTLATIQTLEIARRQVEHRLAVLMGMPPHNLVYLLGGEESIPSAPQGVAVGVPAELVWRRPDVRRAERLVAAQSAEIGVAQSDLYPSISINGVMAQESARLPDLFKSSAFGGVIGPALRWNVLNYGRLSSNVAVQDARFQQLVANYQQTVLRANEEAENAIAAFLYHHEQIGLLEESVREAREAARVTQQKYEGGAIDFNRLFTVEQLLREQQDRLAVARGDLAQSLIQLYKALGGGWEIRLDPMVSHLAPVVPANEPRSAPEALPQPRPDAKDQP